MAADQRRKRLNGASITGCSSKEQHRMKKKKMVSRHDDLNAKSHISLQWDANQKKVIARREQVGISLRDLRPFIDSVPNCQHVVADVFSVPSEIFDLENLSEVLSYEVWENCLSEKERSFLTQFLPGGTNAEQVVQSLLAGDNFNFGNPLFKWGTKLCSGDLHPDMVLHRERCLKADKNSYYSEIHKYHYDMIEYLQRLKESWESCQDPEKEIVEKIWSRPRKGMEKKIPSCANESRLRDLEQDVTATSESSSWIADEKACSSDNQNSSLMKGGELQKRMSEKGFFKEKYGNQLDVMDDMPNVGVRPRLGDKLQKHNIHQSDGTKYMSYLKISKKQHQLVMSMKQSGKSIQSRFLNRVLGNFDSLHVKPYEIFVEEEQKKLREHWLRLANEDLPAAYSNWREIQLQKRKMINSLEIDMKDKLNSQMEVESEENLETIPQDQDNVGLCLGTKDDNKENLECVIQDQKDCFATVHESMMGDERDALPTSLQNHSQLPVSSLSGGSELRQKTVESVDNRCVSKSDNISCNAPELSGDLSASDGTVSQGVPFSSGGDVWPVINMQHSYYNSTASREYTSTSGLQLVHPQGNEEQRSHLVNLESHLRGDDTREDVSQRQSHDGSFTSFANQDRSELLQSLFKGQGMLSYNHEQKQHRVDFQPPNNVLMDSQFSGHFQEQLHPSLPLEQGHKRHNEVFMQQNVAENIYPNGGRYLIPRQELLAQGGVQDWNVPTVRMSAPVQPQLSSGGLLNHNWFSGEHQVRNGWASADGVSVHQGIGSGSNGDQSLFSVFSHCSQLRSGGPFDMVGSTGQFIAPRNYGMVGGGVSGISNGLPQVAHPLDYLGGRDPTASLTPDDMGWMNLPNQNSALHDPMGKPYLRSWNQ